MEFNVSLANRIKLDTHISSNATMIGVTGPSGAGKSSLLRALAGFEPSASVLVDWQFPELKNNKIKIGMVFQQPMLFPHLTVKGNLALAQQYASSHAANYSQVVEGCEIEHLLDKPIQSLSGGEGQRVAIARALLNGPHVLLLDESLSALDISLRHRLLGFLTHLTEQLPMKCVLVSHDLQDLARYSHSLLVIEKQHLSYSGDPQGALNYLNTCGANEHVFSVLNGQVLFPPNRLKEGDKSAATNVGVHNDTAVQRREGESVGVQENAQQKEAGADGLLNGYLCVSVHGHTLYAEAAKGNAAVFAAAENGDIKLVVTANEVSIDTATNTSATTMSIVNAIPCTISEIRASGASGKVASSSLVLLSIVPKNQADEPQILYARVSQLSLTRLNLHPGMQVLARFKMLRV